MRPRTAFALGPLLLLWSLPVLASQPALGEASQDMLRAVGPQASHVLDLWRLMLVLCGVVFAAVLVALALALKDAPKTEAPAEPDIGGLRHEEPRLQRRVLAATVLAAIGLLALVVASAWTDRALGALTLKDALHVRVTANQWWWDLRYDDPDPSRLFHAANELHLPVGRPVILTLQSNDVIHSFWLPNVAGKQDLIPGRTAQLELRIDRPGTYRGQCAEFCGLQHARMAFVVVAEEPARYEAWAERQRQAAAPPADARTARGQQLFLSGTCVMCHNVSGTDASARRAPDLTHLGGRSTLAAGTLPNDPARLAQWIADPQRFKPGVHMPAHRYSAEDMDALVAWLGSLQ